MKKLATDYNVHRFIGPCMDLYHRQELHILEKLDCFDMESSMLERLYILFFALVSVRFLNRSSVGVGVTLQDYSNYRAFVVDNILATQDFHDICTL